MNIDLIKEEFFVESTRVYLDKTFANFDAEMVSDDRFIKV
jgi:hypothetical protein